MARILVASTERTIVVAASATDRILDLLDDDGTLSTKFSCRGASCGVCLARVKSGASALRAPGATEAETLSMHEADPDQRLLCQVVLDGEEDVVFEL